jgi:hypothetical protein
VGFQEGVRGSRTRSDTPLYLDYFSFRRWAARPPSILFVFHLLCPSSIYRSKRMKTLDKGVQHESYHSNQQNQRRPIRENNEQYIDKDGRYALPI